MTKSEFLTWMILLFVYQGYATVLVMRSDDFDQNQKARQIVMIWALPLIGAILVRIALNAARRKGTHDEP